MDYRIEDILPQRRPYILVDKLVHYDEVMAKTIFEIREDNLFCENGMMDEAGLIENIAQTCAAHTGYKAKRQSGQDEKIKIGYLGMIKEMKIMRKARVGETLTTTVEIKAEVFSTTLIGAKVEVDNETIAECEMKIFLTDKTVDGK
ncbi:MAG: pseudouridylate synthase [Tannerella sp.]|jgi:predicted hotdog family 3-hydroxylacyl-ACP dehydratase|nr:pseudouridylate synthase [Tannerella sp.]